MKFGLGVGGALVMLCAFRFYRLDEPRLAQIEAYLALRRGDGKNPAPLPP